MYTDSTLQPIYDYQQYISVNGTIYPPHFPKNEIPGVFPVTLAPRPTDPSLVVTGFTINAINNQRVQIWQTREKTEDELSSERKSQALAALSKSDLVMNRINEAVSLGLTKWKANDVVAYVRYRRTLRAIVGGAPDPLPDPPDYPQGT